MQLHMALQRDQRIDTRRLKAVPAFGVWSTDQFEAIEITHETIVNRADDMVRCNGHT